jgi:hypothetical protein
MSCGSQRLAFGNLITNSVHKSYKIGAVSDLECLAGCGFPDMSAPPCHAYSR